LKVTVLAVGKLRDRWVREGCDEYRKRLRGKLAVEEIELKSSDQLERRIPERDRLWVLDAGGKALSSEDLAAALESSMRSGRDGITFVIGGAEGLLEDIRRRADVLLSFGRVTLPHRLARLILMEQLYRAISIVRREPYHK
jgi:23S rRNA (pseudouridine1915-N3)-methyltransferase